MTNLGLAGKLQKEAEHFSGAQDIVGMLWDAGAALRNLHTENTALRVTEDNLRQELQECQDQRRAAFRRIEELERKSDQDDETILWQAKKISEKTDKLAERDARIAELEQRNSDLDEDVQRFKKHALNEKSARLELERQLEEARNQVLEEAAKVCDELAELSRTSPTDSMRQHGECAAAIRALKGAKE